ncbi:hypothetical protein [Streptomyces sp. I05A-00742]|uniref:hypothetical protein n=1 Tax=Streptomyces sp. I05A-00742 TaxID=2732853 RepID=UPI0014888202|nr:hypothetical protein [Streptomyces sp. I05A-00742]
MLAGRHTRTPGTAQTRLPWWAVALPALAFTALFVLLGAPAPSASATPASATPASAEVSAAPSAESVRAEGAGPVAQVVRLARRTLDHWIP